MVLNGARAPRQEGAGGARLLVVPGRVCCMDESHFFVWMNHTCTGIVYGESQYSVWIMTRMQGADSTDNIQRVEQIKERRPLPVPAQILCTTSTDHNVYQYLVHQPLSVPVQIFCISYPGAAPFVGARANVL